LDWVLYKSVHLKATPENEANYYVEVVVPWEEGMNPDFSDISFVELDGYTLIPQYRMSYTSGVTSTWCIKTSYKLAGGKDIFLLFSNSGAVLRSDREDVFNFWDDGAVSGMDKWNVTFPSQVFKQGGYIKVQGDMNTSPYYGTISSKTLFGLRTGVKITFMQKGGPTTGVNAWQAGFKQPSPSSHYHLLDAFVPRKYYGCGNDSDPLDDLGADVLHVLDIQRYADTEVRSILDGELGFVNALDHDDDIQMAVFASDFTISYGSPQFPVYLLIKEVLVYNIPSDGIMDIPTLGPTGETMDVWGTDTMLNGYIDDISFRIGNPMGNRWQYYPHIQRTLQRLYWRLNKQYRLVKDELEMDFSTLGTFVAYWTLPRWFMKLYKLEPNYDWREPDEYDGTAGTYTINGGRIYFGGIDATDVVTAYFYSSGKIFTTKADADLLEGEINVPEWTDRSLDQALYYGACIELKQDYPGFNHDVNEYNELKKRMFDSFDSDQDKDLVLPGDPDPAPPDAYGWVN
jgi:hypothetical protein